MNDILTVYVFYLVAKKIDDTIFPGIGSAAHIHHNNGYCSTIYAYTTRKDVAKAFMLMRDNSKFERRKVYMTLVEYERFSADYSTYQLADNSYKLGVIDENNYLYKVESVYVLSTEEEHNSVVENGSERILSYIDSSLPENIEIEKSIDALWFLIHCAEDPIRSKYSKSLKKLFVNRSFLNTVLYQMEAVDRLDQLIDEASLFIHLYSNTFKEGREISCDSLSFTKNQKRG